MKRFNSMDDMLEYGRTNLGEFDYEKVLLGDKLIILCGTEKAYEELLWSQLNADVENFFETFAGLLEKGLEDEEKMDTSLMITQTTTKLRDRVIKNFEILFGVQFISARQEN